MEYEDRGVARVLVLAQLSVGLERHDGLTEDLLVPAVDRVGSPPVARGKGRDKLLPRQGFDRYFLHEATVLRSHFYRYRSGVSKAQPADWFGLSSLDSAPKPAY